MNQSLLFLGRRNFATALGVLLSAFYLFPPSNATAADAQAEDARIAKLEKQHADVVKQNADLLAQLKAIQADFAALKKAQESAPKSPGAPAAKASVSKAERAKTATAAAAAGGEAKVKSKGQAEEVLAADLKTLKATPVTLKQISDAFDVPASPAAAVLGLSEDKVQHLNTPKQFVPAVISGLDEHGHFQSGLSVDFAPAQYFWRDRPVTDFRYERNATFGESLPIWFERVLVRTQISFATAKGASTEDKSSKIALGIHSVIVNSDDPLSNAHAVKIIDEETGLTRIVSAESGKENGRRLDATGHKLNHWVIGVGDQSEEDLYFCGKGVLCDIGNFLYTHTSLAVGAAPEWIAKDDSESYQYSGTTAWASFAYVPSRQFAARFVLDAIYHDGELVPAANAIGGTTIKGDIKQDSLLLIGGVRVGNRDFNAILTGAYLHLDQGSFGTDSAFRYTLAAEKRIGTSNTWLTLSLSKDEGHADGKNPTLALGGMKIGLGGRDFSSADQKARALQAAD